MELDGFLEPEVAVTAAVAAVVFSPGARKLMRRGLVYSVAGVLIAGEALTSLALRTGAQMAGKSVTSLAHRMGQGIRQAVREATTGQPEVPAQG